MRALFVGSVTAVCLGVALWLAWEYALPIPFWDEWLWIPYATGDAPVTLEWLWEPYNEHRLPLPKLIYLLWAWLTGMNARILAVGGTLAFGGLAVASIVLATRLRGRGSYFDVFFPLLLLHGTHLENLIWPFQIGFVLPAALTLLILFLVIGKRPIGIAVCLLVLSLCGPVGLPVVVLLSPWVILRGRNIVAAVLSSVSLIISILHFVGLERPEAVAPSPSLWASLLAGIQCLSTGMGQRAEEIWPVSGILVLILMGVSFLQIRKARAGGMGLVLLGLCGLSLGIGHARAGLGEEPIFVFRYTTITCGVLWIAYVASLLSPSRSPSRVIRVLLVAMLGGLFWPNTEQWIRRGKERSRHGEALAADVRAGVPIDEIASRHWAHWYPDWNGFVIGMEQMAGARLALFRDHALVPAAGGMPTIWTAREVSLGSADSGIPRPLPDGGWGLYAHAPSALAVDVPADAEGIRIAFGILPNQGSDGVTFRMTRRGEVLWEIHAERPGTQEVTLEIPVARGDEVILETLPGPRGNSAWDWAYWAGIDFTEGGP